MSKTEQTTGILRKLVIDPGEPAVYQLPMGAARIALNPLLGREITMTFSGVIRCLGCDRVTRKSFNQGYCYRCFKSLAECDLCIVRPEQCHYHEGTCRDPAWGEQHCMQPHVVYLSATSGVKVGVTRKSQVPTRWLDQGATQAMTMFEVPTRRDAGVIEAALKAYVADRTNWRAMLKGDSTDSVGLDAHAETLLETAAGILADKGVGGARLQRDPAKVHQYQYPVAYYPEKIRSASFDKSPTITGRLTGMKGQYLMLDTTVVNIRRHAGYEITFSPDRATID